MWTNRDANNNIRSECILQSSALGCKLKLIYLWKLSLGFLVLYFTDPITPCFHTFTLQESKERDTFLIKLKISPQIFLILDPMSPKVLVIINIKLDAFDSCTKHEQ
jgi:hypothetical protein